MSQYSVRNGSSLEISTGPHPGACSSTVTAACVRTYSELEQLSNDWRELFFHIRCRNPFLTPEWMVTWWSHWGDTHRLLLIKVQNAAGRLVAVAPFFIRNSRMGEWGPRVLCLIGTHPFVGSYHLNLLVDPDYEHPATESIVHLLTEKHQSEWDYVDIASSYEESSVLM